jgi:hypothetical protein
VNDADEARNLLNNFFPTINPMLNQKSEQSVLTPNLIHAYEEA